MTGLQTIFVLGKGGTGKSTAAALMALALASRGKKTLLASLDDAHNQSDIFQREFTHDRTAVTPCLDVLQVNRDREIRRYLAKTAGQVKTSFSYLTAFNLDHYFDVLKLSPGMEEYALVTAFESLVSRYKDVDFLIADMPPTALSLRFFNLPALSLAWIDRLEALRMDIRKKKEVISTIRFGKKEFERDKILARIREIKSAHQDIRSRFQDPLQSRVVTVSNPDLLSRSETGRIHEEMLRLGIGIHAAVRNCRMPEFQSIRSREADLRENEPVPVIDIPFSPSPLIGMNALEHFIQIHGLVFAPVF